jgi:cleavage and polyadenylation specificity factor subunit 4
MKDKQCEFLHQHDESKMPLCKHGDRCRTPGCKLRHIKEEDRLECVFYTQGFCIHGPNCRYKHIKRPSIDLPLVSNYTLGLSQMQAGNAAMNGNIERRGAARNELYKKSLCKHFSLGSCPFGDSCNFAHGKEELARHTQASSGNGNGIIVDGEINESVFGNDNDDNSVQTYFSGKPVGGGLPNPITEPLEARYFLCAVAKHLDVAYSIESNVCFIPSGFKERIAQCLSENRKVVLGITVADSLHIQGLCFVQSVSDGVSKVRGFVEVKVDWLRVMELPYKSLSIDYPDIEYPSQPKQKICVEITPHMGDGLLSASWNCCVQSMYEPIVVKDGEDPPADMLSPFYYPPRDLHMWPIPPRTGFIFGCNTSTMGEALGRGIFGLPKHMMRSAEKITPGSLIYLLNVTDGLLFGIFEAVSTMAYDIEPRLFSKNPKATTSPFPVQVRVRVALECPPLDETDSVLSQILRDRNSNTGRIGELSHSQTAGIANLLATRCGALSYMKELADNVKSGKPYKAPPITMPPDELLR